MNNYKNSILKFSRRKHLPTYVHKLEFIDTGDNICHLCNINWNVIETYDFYKFNERKIYMMSWHWNIFRKLYIGEKESKYLCSLY